MAWNSDVARVTDVPKFFACSVYHLIWERAAERFRQSRLGTFLANDQLNIAADQALRTVAHERHLPHVFHTDISAPYWLYGSLKWRGGLFPPEHDYVKHLNFCYAPPHVQQDFYDMLAMAGQVVYEWEKENGRIPTDNERLEFLGAT